MNSHTLDGYSIRVGDTVYDVAFGPGKVTYLGDNGSVNVEFARGRTVGYQDGRTQRFSQQTLFWKNPIIVNPPKDDERWAVVRPMAQAAANVVRQLNITNEA